MGNANHMTQKEKEFIIFDFGTIFQERIAWLFERRNIDGLFPVFFILYSYKHGLPVSFDGGGLNYCSGKDALQDRLHDASLMAFGGDKSQFAGLSELQGLLVTIKKRLFDEAYCYLLDRALGHTDLVAGTQMQPNSRIATTIANILKEGGCQTVFGAYSGIGIYALACKNLKYTGAEPYAPANLIAEVLCDAFNVNKAHFLTENPLEKWPRRKYDAVIGNLPVDADFFNIYRANVFLHHFNQLQETFVRKLIERKTARKMAALLIHFEFANYGSYDETRRRICEKGMLKTVIALPEDIFRDAYVPSYLLILDMEGGRNDAEFINAKWSNRRQTAFLHTFLANKFDVRECVKDNERTTVSYNDIARASWSFNPSVYIQNAECREGQELVRLGDLVRFSCGRMTKGERYISYDALSDSFSRVAAGITPAAPTHDENQLVEGPCILVALTRGSRREEQRIQCGICREFGTYSVTFFLAVLKPDIEKILPEYLVLALMSDPSFARYFKDIQEYYTDDVRSSHILERRIPILVDLADQKKAIMDALERSDMAEMTYNIVIAGAGEELGRYRNEFAKYGCNILASVDTVEGPEGLENLLIKMAGKNVPISQKADAVVSVSDIPLRESAKEEPFSGLDAVLDLQLLYGSLGLKFFVSSKHSLEAIHDAGIISSRRLKTLTEGHFFMTSKDGRPSNALAVSLREELDRAMTPESRIRSRHQTAFEAATWIDSHYSVKDIRTSETLSDFLMAAEEGADSSRNLSELRNVAHRIIEILKECRAVPPIDNGAIPHFLYDRKYENKKDGKTYIQDVSIMRRSLASSLISLIDIGNEGTHSFRTSANLGSAMLQTLLEFVTWFYEKREDFSTVLTNYWHLDSKYERNWEETSGPATVRMVAGKPFWTCREIHLYVPQDSDLQEGDLVTVRRRMEDNSSVKVPGVKYFAYPKGFKNTNPDGYVVTKKNKDYE